MNLTTKATMSSLEIAALTGKEHFHVMRDIKVMLEELGDESSFGCIYLDSMNREKPQYKLPKRECLILVSGYNIKMRAAIIDRWQELEEVVLNLEPPTPKNSPAELIRVLHAVSDALRVSESSRLGMINRALREFTPEIAHFTPTYAIDAPTNAFTGSSSVSHSLTYLLKEHNIEGSTVTWNKKLLSAGFLEQKSRSSSDGGLKLYWSITEKGLEYGKNLVNEKSLKKHNHIGMTVSF